MTAHTTDARSPRQDDWLNDDAYDDLSWLPDDDDDDEYIDPAEAARRDALAMRRALGVDDVYGYHVEDRRFDEGDDPAGDVVGPHDEAPELQEPAYPCLDGHRYSGCLGQACPCQRCWTGGPTPRLATRLQQFGQASETLSVPGAPCLSCLHAHTEEVTLPLALTRRTDDALSPGVRRVSEEPVPYRSSPAKEPTIQSHGRGREGAPDRPGAGEKSAERVERVTCGRGLWLHAVSPAAFAARRLPLVSALEVDLEGHVECPAFEPRAETHPVVEAHLAQRRQRDRARRHAK